MDNDNNVDYNMIMIMMIMIMMIMVMMMLTMMMKKSKDHQDMEYSLNQPYSRHQGNEEGSGSSPTLNPFIKIMSMRMRMDMKMTKLTMMMVTKLTSGKVPSVTKVP